MKSYPGTGIDTGTEMASEGKPIAPPLASGNGQSNKARASLWSGHLNGLHSTNHLKTQHPLQRQASTIGDHSLCCCN